MTDSEKRGDPIAEARAVMARRMPGEWRANNDGSVRATGPIAGEHGQHFNRLIALARFAPEDARAIALAVNTHEALLAVAEAAAALTICPFCVARFDIPHAINCPTRLALSALEQARER